MHLHFEFTLLIVRGIISSDYIQNILSCFCGFCLFHTQVPLSYLQLYDAVTKEAELRAASNKPPILTADELLQIAKDNPDNDIYDTEELNHGKIHTYHCDICEEET